MGLRVRFEAAQARIADKEGPIAAQNKALDELRSGLDELRSRIEREAEERRQLQGNCGSGSKRRKLELPRRRS